MADDKDIVRKYFYTEILKTFPDLPIKYTMPKFALGMFDPADPLKAERSDSIDEVSENIRRIVKYLKLKIDKN